MFDILRHAGRASQSRYLLAFVGLMLLVAGTAGLRAVHVNYASATVEERQEEVVQRALEYGQDDLRALQQRLVQNGEAISADEDVVRTLRVRLRGERPDAMEQVVRTVREQRLPQRSALEVYDSALNLLAWSGFSMPLTDVPTVPNAEDGVYVIITQDNDVRRALTVWVPVRDGPDVVGFVRAMHLLDKRTPVQNQYLRDYSRADEWWRHTGLVVRLETANQPLHVQPGEREQIVTGIDGRELGRLVVEEPSAENVVATIAERYDATLMLWITLLLGWALFGLWVWYRRSPSRSQSMVLRFMVLAGAWWGTRYLLLGLDVPARWQQPRAPLAPLFDPSHFASTLGSGLMRSTGDFLLSAMFALVFSITLVGLVQRLLQLKASKKTSSAAESVASTWRDVLAGGGALAAAVAAVAGGMIVLSQIVHHALRDSTLDYFTTTGLLPDLLVLTVFCALLITGLAYVLIATGVLWFAYDVARWWLSRYTLGLLVLVGSVLAVVGMALWAPAGVSWFVVVVVGLIIAGAAWVGYRHLGRELHLLSLRSVLLAVIALGALLYPMFYSGMHQQRQVQMVEAATSFDEGQDPRAVFAIHQLLNEALEEPALSDVLEMPIPPVHRRAILDSLSALLMRGSFLASLGSYDVSFTIFDAQNTPVGRYDTPGTGASRAMLDRVDTHEFRILRQMYEDALSFGPRVEQITGRREPDRFQYAGITAVHASDGWDPFDEPLGWVMVRAEPRAALLGEGTPFPRVLLPAGSYGDLTQQMSMAEFRDGRLVRSLGRSFGRYRLDSETNVTLASEGQLWRTERVDDQRYLTYYRHQPYVTRPVALTESTGVPAIGSSVLAVRIPAIGIFDHLYYLLRLTVAGLFVAIPFYLLGLFLRRRAGLLPAPYVRFRDRALNAFLLVGIVAVAAVGIVGQQVVVAEADNAVRSWLRQHLERVEEALAQEMEGNEMPYHVLERMSTDELASRVGLDLNIYREGRLVSSSRPQLVRDRLIDERLPASVYDALYYGGYRFSFEEERLGTFRYLAGYYALPDEQGDPHYVVSVPTLPEQERIEQERARTVAYLFGALLLLVLTVMLTAAMLAGAMARPIARLRTGLEDVARGRFEQTIPVDSRDEIGELVETFNTMQAQLAESRRKLAQQERQLAWREMARQVAHEIKNPLTPMKLSVQNLQRAFEDADLRNGAPAPGANAQNDRFASYFDRVTNTLIEQINTLARIANEFSSFARLPQRILERQDLNAVIREAVTLMQAEGDVDISLDLHPEPLVIEADREEVRRIYINLIKNAVQAIPGDEDALIRIRTTVLEEDDTVWAASAVEDNGTGIPEKVQDRIFEPNFSTKTSGTGLGLAIVKKSVVDMQGRITFETEEDVGTTFHIRLPLLKK